MDAQPDFYPERGLPPLRPKRVSARKAQAAGSAGEAAEAEDPIAKAASEVVGRIDAIIRPEIETASSPADLDYRVDRLLFNDELTKSFLQLAGVVAGNLMRETARGTAVEWRESIAPLVGRELAEKISVLLRETERATRTFFAALVSLQAQGHTVAAPEEVPPETGAFPSLYMATPYFPPELKRALAGRDMGAILYVGIANAMDWRLPAPRTVELCERFIDNQARWLDFLSCLPGVSVASEVLPGKRVNWEEAFQRTQMAHHFFARTVHEMERTGERIHFLVPRER